MPMCRVFHSVFFFFLSVFLITPIISIIFEINTEYWTIIFIDFFPSVYSRVHIHTHTFPNGYSQQFCPQYNRESKFLDEKKIVILFIMWPALVQYLRHFTINCFAYFSNIFERWTVWAKKIASTTNNLIVI